ncbi:MAG: glycosyltransferase [Verrucomicrobiota bacterium]
MLHEEVRRSIFLVTISLADKGGGLERNIIRLANELASQGEMVSLVTFDEKEVSLFYPLDDRVKLKCIGVSKPHKATSISQKLKLLVRLLRIYSSKGVIIAFHHGLMSRLILGRLFGCRVVCSERNAPSIYDYITEKRDNRNFWLLRFSNAVTVQFKRYAAGYPHVRASRLFIVPNPVRVEESHEDRRNVILSVGRLEAQKQFHLLIEAFASAEKPRGWELRIIGNGDRREFLVSEIARLKLSESVNLLPSTEDIAKHYHEASFYCQPSQWEGFPNAQAEAMAAGCIPIGFEKTWGVSDLIRDGENGLLVSGDFAPGGLAAVLSNAMKNADSCEPMRFKAMKIAEEYSDDKWRKAWGEVLASIK